MRSIPALIILLSFAGNAYCQSDTTLPVKMGLKLLRSDTQMVSKDRWLDAIKKGTYYITTDSVKLKTFDVELSIQNTSSDPIAIWLMSCSWPDGFQVNNDYMYIRGWNCDINSPDPVPFKAGEIKTFTCTLEKSIKFDYPSKNTVYGYQAPETRLGLVITSVTYTTKLNMMAKNGFEPTDRSKWRVIWSNPLYLFGEQAGPRYIPVYQN